MAWRRVCGNSMEGSGVVYEQNFGRIVLPSCHECSSAEDFGATYLTAHGRPKRDI